MIIIIKKWNSCDRQRYIDNSYRCKIKINVIVEMIVTKPYLKKKYKNHLGVRLKRVAWLWLCCVVLCSVFTAFPAGACKKERETYIIKNIYGVNTLPDKLY